MSFRGSRPLVIVAVVLVAVVLVALLPAAPAAAAPPVCAASGQPCPQLTSFERTSASVSAVGQTVTTRVGVSGGARPLQIVVNFLNGSPLHALESQFIHTTGSAVGDAGTGTTSGVVQAGRVLGGYAVYNVVLVDAQGCTSIHYQVTNVVDYGPSVPGHEPQTHSVPLGAGSLTLIPADEFAWTDDQRYTNALTQLFFGRSATDHELLTATNQLSALGRLGVTRQMAASPEWAGRVVDDIYRAALDRDPDPGGRVFWTNRLLSDGRTRDVAVSIYGSPEAYAAAGGAPAGFVDALYNRILGRDPDAAGWAYWIAELTSGRANPKSVVDAFWESIESRRQRVQTVYHNVLGRPADSSGLAYWSGRLLVEDDVQLAALLAASDEFYGNAIQD
ncbi:MAG: DUF4214 domain-containing protein [Actinomycetota bacterium]|nr:DUF4214 domain-containing protein [Actinomycetota bacterium]